ncbi:MAG: rhomboid family intramembrane serine protease [Saprospiraceae bacterium]
MKGINPKIIHVFIPFVIVTLVTIIGYSIIRWLLEIKLGFLPIQDTWLDFMFPLFFSYLAVSICLNKRIQILDIHNKKKDHSFNYKLALVVLITVPFIISQHYISSASYDLNHLDSPAEIQNLKNEKFFKIDQFNIDQQKCISYVTSTITGKYNDDLNFKLYYACPFEETNASVFYGIKYYKQIDNDFTDIQKQAEYEDFLTESQTKFVQVDFKKADYFKKESYSNNLKNYEAAILEKFPNINLENQIILTPENGSFVNRNDGSFKWFFIMLGIAFFIYALMVAIPKLNKGGLKAFHNNKNLYESSFPFFLNLLIPIGKSKGLSLLLLCNCIVFFIMICSGIDFLYPSPQELFEFGGKTKDSILQGEYWRLFTAMFIHRGATHLFSNLVALAIAGFFLEPILKSFKFVTIYLLCGIISGIASIYWYPTAVSIGASGAISGLFGMLVLFNFIKIFDNSMTSIIWMIFFTLLSLMIFSAFVMNNISHAAHIIGFVSGCFVGLLLTLVQGNVLKKEARLHFDF